jgi:hypothetical protein
MKHSESKESISATVTIDLAKVNIELVLGSCSQG